MPRYSAAACARRFEARVAQTIAGIARRSAQGVFSSTGPAVPPAVESARAKLRGAA